MAIKIDIDTLTREVRETRDEYPAWCLDNAFVHWFLKAFLVSDPVSAAQAVTGTSGDKDVDAVLIEDNLAKVFVLQGKFHKTAKPPQEGRDSVLSFARLAHVLAGPDAAFAAHRKGLDANVTAKLRVVRQRIRQRKYSLQLYYVTTGRCSTPLKTEAESVANSVPCDVSVSIFDRADVLNLLTDYLSGAAPPVPYLDLKISTDGASESLLHRYDAETEIESWILTMSGRDLADLYEKTGDRLFARNIRGFLGDSAINQGMVATLRTDPHHFWYFNNGVTIVCDSARTTGERGILNLRVNNPQIINGQQTTRTLHEHVTRNAAVLVRVISIRRSASNVDFERLVSNIVAATNWQNAILPSDLRSNDARQVALERDFAKVGYHYLRKRQTKREARRALGHQRWIQLKKDEIAQVVGACELDPQIVRSGKEGLFKPPTYDKIFSDRPVREYLAMYWLARLVKRKASGYPDRAYAKWHVLHFAWYLVGKNLSARRTGDYFRHEAERNRWNEALAAIIEQVHLAAQAFFRANRGEGPTAVDVSNFFYRASQHRKFDEFWNLPLNEKRRVQVTRLLDRFRREMDEAVAT